LETEGLPNERERKNRAPAEGEPRGIIGGERDPRKEPGKAKGQRQHRRASLSRDRKG